MQPTPGLDAKLHQWFDDHADDVVKLAQDLISIPSVNPKFNPEESPYGEANVQEYIADYLHRLGMDPVLYAASDDRLNLHTPLNPEADRTIAFNGHVDVVPAGDERSWSFPPFSGALSNGRIYGRGAMDMKGGIASALLALRALHDTGFEIDGKVGMHTVVDEEAGGFGTRDLLSRMKFAPDGVIVGEPSNEEIQIAAGGLDWVRVTIRGRSGHAGWRFAEIYPQPFESPERDAGTSINAIDLASNFLQAVNGLERQWSATKVHPLLPPGITTISPGVIRGGSGLDGQGLPTLFNNPAVIPDSVAIDFDLKFIPGDDDSVRAEFEDFVSTWAKQHYWTANNPPLVKWEVADLRFPSMDTPFDDSLVTALSQSVEASGSAPQVTGFPAVADSAFYAAAGSAAVIYGPQGGGIHGPDEWVSIDSLKRVSRNLSLAALAYLDGR
ncbi:M20 family metallopeptidase [Brevibacterium sp. CFH 10365]|uniref:M20 family metallopeptidase n=1 Tax=Brevibacterium sp. CFH 10365 TaxID=2585207 RepID=UPI0012667A79|nr:ArgE/DapE family deacylase [Brevibacterium sp. CFH 10365]